MDGGPDNLEEHREAEPEAFTGIYQPRRGPMAKAIAVLILVVLVLVPLILALATMHRWDPARPPGPAAPETTSPASE
ncbi:MAG: hypothetical protein JXB13_14285 [Phycisphaerae bacterium]|nr:hypothetical protein [Phycisphaerae bacterium]